MLKLSKNDAFLILLLYLALTKNISAKTFNQGVMKIQDIDTKNKSISFDSLQQYEKSSGEQKKKLQVQIVENVLNNLLKFEDIPLANSSELKVVYGNVVGDSRKDAIFIVKIGPKNTIVAVYERDDSGYKFKGLLNNFMEIRELKTAKLQGNTEEIIILLEYTNQLIGALEDGTILRAYRWNEQANKFEQVLEAQKDYKSYWNELYDNSKPKEQSHWLKIQQNASNDNEQNESIRLNVNQNYQRSKTTNSVNMPEESDFQTLNEKNFSKLYYWDNKWKQYILGEGVEINTGLIVAILEDLEQQPFSLIEADKRYKIKRLDGEISTVDKNTVQAEF